MTGGGSPLKLVSKFFSFLFAGECNLHNFLLLNKAITLLMK